MVTIEIINEAHNADQKSTTSSESLHLAVSINIAAFITNENKIKFVAYVTEKDETLTSWDSYFTPLDFGWNGNISNYDINEFIETDFDALISYYDEDIHELNLITAKSKANFKIGISNKDQRLHDFIINIKSSFIDIFKVELEKYLKGLKNK